MHLGIFKNRYLQAVVAASIVASMYLMRDSMSAKPKSDDLTNETVTVFSAEEAFCLVEACQLMALINDGKWDEVDKLVGENLHLAELRHTSARREDWPGIGAYKSAVRRVSENRVITFHFGMAPRTNSHEIWISFATTASGHSKPGVMVMGW